MNVGRYIFAQITAFIPRYAKDNMRFEVTHEFTDDRLTSFVCADYAVRFTGYKSKHSYPDELRIVKVNDPSLGSDMHLFTIGKDQSRYKKPIYYHRSCYSNSSICFGTN